MTLFAKELKRIRLMLEANDYGVRDGMMPHDDFRLFLTPPGLEDESEEVFKLKGSGKVCCGSEIIMGGNVREVFFQQTPKEQARFKELLAGADGVGDLDFFETVNDGKDFQITIRTEFQVDELSEEVFGDAMDRLNIAGGSIEDMWNEYFDGLLSV